MSRTHKREHPQHLGAVKRSQKFRLFNVPRAFDPAVNPILCLKCGCAHWRIEPCERQEYDSDKG